MPSQTPETVLALLALPIRDFVQNAYLILLDRQPEPHEIKARAAALRTGWGRVRLLENITSSPEFAAREQRLLKDGSPRAFVERNYLLFMNRMPDEHGLDHYTQMLDAGTTRDVVRRDIANSTEALATGSFWVELERLLVDERKNMHRFERWFGLLRRQERRRNLEMEISQRQREEQLKLARGQAMQNFGIVGSIDPLDGDQSQDEQLALIQNATNDVDMVCLPPATKRILSRLRHPQPKTWSIAASIEGIY